MICCRVICHFLFAYLLLLPLAAFADDAPQPAASAAPPGTLAQALTDAEPSPEDLYLTVAPEKVVLPPGAEPPRKGDTDKQVAADYDRLVWVFNSVTAVAPPIMTVLNTAPGTPNPYAGMPSGDAFKLLLGSLSDAQWQALTGKTGLGDSDLIGDTQHALFQAMFPSGTLTLNLAHATGGGAGSTSSEDIMLNGDDLKAARLRLGQKVQIALPREGQPGSTMALGTLLAGQTEYYGGSEPAYSKDMLYGVSLRQTVPNTLKSSDLDFDQEALTRKVPLDGVKTVGDLILRIGAATKIEMYADRRYEKRNVILLGPKSAPAKDLLRALALCVSGAYRRVGPAFVLTEDRIGVAVQRTTLVRFAQEADMARHPELAEAGDKLILAHGGLKELPALDGDLGFSDTQKALADQPGHLNIPGQGISLDLPLAQLTPQQQDFARCQAQEWNDAQQNSTQPNGLGRVTLDGKFSLSAQTTLQLTSPKVPGPVDLQVSDLYRLFEPSPKVQQKLWEQQNQRSQAAAKADPSPPGPPPAPTPPLPPLPLPPLSSLLGPIPRRAVIARAATAAEVDSIIASMKTIGLNQLWLEVFSGGKSLLDAHTPDGKPDILTEALARTKGTGIVVIPTLDLLKWGLDAPADARDLTLMGETSAQDQARQQRYSAIVYQNMTAAEADKQPLPDSLSACPVAPSVQTTLEGIVRRLAATPGIAALALRETVTRGYDRPADSALGQSGDDLGYVPALRLAFLRRDHVDPLDLEPAIAIRDVPLDMSLPDFDDRNALGAVDKDWNALRYSANAGLMQRLLVNAQQAAGRRIPFLVKARRFSLLSNWYGLWDDPRAPLPAVSEKLAKDSPGANTDYAAFAHTQSRAAVYEFNRWNAQSKDGLVSGIQQMKPGWDGFVLDVSADPSGSLLAGLAKSVTPPRVQSEADKNPQK